MFIKKGYGLKWPQTLTVWPNEQHVIIKQTYKTQVAAFEAPVAEGQ